MATKTQANWSQGSNNDKPQQLRTVHTCKNTTLAAWQDMVKLELANSNIAFESIRDLTLLHAWEMGDTPYAFAYMLKDQHKRRQNSAHIRENNKR